MITIGIIDGTARPDGQTRKLVVLTEKLLRAEGAKVQVFSQLHEKLPIYDGTKETSSHPSVQRLFDVVAGNETIVLSSPEYHNSMSGAIKNALDWVTDLPDDKGLTGKLVGLMGGGGSFGNSGAILQMMMAVRSMHGWVMPNIVVSIAQIWNAFDEDGELRSESDQRRLQDFCRELIDQSRFRQHGQKAASDQVAVSRRA